MELSPMGAASATGVSVHQLRLWERRYGFPAPSRTATGRRVYGPGEVEAIRLMHRLISAGVPGEAAARAARQQLAAPVAPASPGHGGEPARLFDAVEALDGAALAGLLDGAFAARPPEAAFDEVVAPFLRAIGAAWEAGEATSAHEHFASQAVRRAFERHYARPAAASGAPVLIACPAGEEHDLPAALLATTLEWHGRAVVALGGDLPAESLAAAVARAKPAAVCLIVTGDSSVPAARLAGAAVLRAGVPLYVAGRAAAALGANPLPGTRLVSFQDAVRALATNPEGSTR